MITNQTIDGVPGLRELLERVATEANHMLGFTYASNYDDCRTAVDELRALLDAPADPASALNRAWQAGYDTGYYAKNPAHERTAALLDSPIPFPGYPPVPEDRKLPAAQPQGEPVAWMDPRSPEMHATISNEVKQHNLKFCGAPSAAVNGYSIPLYAEQPAPVAVVLPERREPTQDNPYLSDADHEWNAFRDELKRLNPSL